MVIVYLLLTLCMSFLIVLSLVKLSSSSTLAFGAHYLIHSVPKLWQSARIFILFDQLTGGAER